MERSNKGAHLPDVRSGIPKPTGRATRSTTQRNRSSSGERSSSNKGTNNPFLSVPSSANKASSRRTMATTPRVTQNRTPQSTSKPLVARRTVFHKNGSHQMDERLRRPFFIGAAAIGGGVAGGTSSSTSSGVSDKHCIQERVNRITEYLVKKCAGGHIYGLSVDFQNRGLRQMTLGHFISIVNHFLRYIVGDRFVVGENYVEDICNLLPNLRYPHAINRSWLKSPNTQQAFTNVVLLLDFLMEFILSDQSNKNQNQIYDDHERIVNDKVCGGDRECPGAVFDHECHFDLDVPKTVQIPDIKFQRQLLYETGKAYPLWIAGEKEEYLRGEGRTIDYLVCKTADSDQVRCVDDLPKKIRHLQEQIKEVEDRLINYNNVEMQKNLDQLNDDMEVINKELSTLMADKERIGRIIEKYEWEEADLKTKCSKLQSHINEYDNKENECTENSQHQLTIQSRNQLISKVTVMKHNVGIEERTLEDVRNRSYEVHTESLHLSIEISDLIEKFNREIRNFVYSQFLLNNQKFQLPLNLADRKSIDYIPALLIKLNDKVRERNEGIEQQITEIREKHLYLEVIMHRINLKLNALRSQDTHELNKLQEYRKGHENVLQRSQEQRVSILRNLENLENETVQMKIYLKEKYKKLHELEAVNEMKIEELEKKHKMRCEHESQFLLEYKKLLEENQSELDNLKKHHNDDKAIVIQLREKLDQLTTSDSTIHEST